MSDIHILKSSRGAFCVREATMATGKKLTAMWLMAALFLPLFSLGLAIETSVAQEASFGVQDGITYATAGGLELKLDIAYPTGGKGLYPALIYICGNAWGWDSPVTRKEYHGDIQDAAKRGYVAVSVDFRTTNIKENGKSKFLFPAQLQDVKCAVRWLRANASRYQIDSNHIGAIGWSSGGHLALMIGLTDPSDGFEGECGDMHLSSQVQAVVNLSGPTELVSLSKESPIAALIMVDLLGGKPDELPLQYYAASPVNYVSKDDPPVLSIQGDVDATVVPRQAEILDAKMKQVGVSHTLMVKKGFGHQNLSSENAIWEFFDKILKYEH